MFGATPSGCETGIFFRVLCQRCLVRGLFEPRISFNFTAYAELNILLKTTY